MKILGGVLGALLISVSAFAVDYGQIERELNSTGAVGWIHGAVPSEGLYVFTYRNPQNFFDYGLMSVVTFDPAIMHQLEKLNRHDQIRLKGNFLPNPSPQKHILVKSIEMVKPYANAYSAETYHYDAKIPEELLNLTSATFLVHAIGGDGHILVVEYKDGVCPIFVQNAELTKNLYRNDVVKLKFKIQSSPQSPTHLVLDEAASDALQVVDAIVAKHGKPALVEGTLILFPKSPEIVLNVFAVEDSLANGLHRQYTLANMTDPDVFQAIVTKLQAAWDRHPGQYVNGRNKLMSKVLKVRAKGTFNEVDPGQANAQILMNSADDVQVLESR